MEILISFLIVLAVIAILVVGIYNSLVKLRNKVRNTWANVETYLKRRSDLIPNLVETVKGYATHEKETLDAVINARSSFQNAKTIGEKVKSSNQITQTLGKLFALSEAYPDLKANQNFLKLQTELSDTENQIAEVRTIYNDGVRLYTNKIEQFPSSIVAKIFNFKKMEFFETQELEKELPKVEF